MAPEFWDSAELQNAFAQRDMGALVYAYRSHPAHGRRPLTQAVMSSWLGITQSQLSRLESGRNRVRDLDKLIHYARVLGLPAGLLWFEVPAEPLMHAGPLAIEARLPAGLRVPANVISTERGLADSLLLTLQQYAAADNLAGSRSLVAVGPHQGQFIEQMVGRSHGHAAALRRSPLRRVRRLGQSGRGRPPRSDALVECRPRLRPGSRRLASDVVHPDA